MWHSGKGIGPGGPRCVVLYSWTGLGSSCLSQCVIFPGLEPVGADSSYIIIYFILLHRLVVIIKNERSYGYTLSCLEEGQDIHLNHHQHYINLPAF